MQPKMPAGEMGPNPAISEDCLYINIWRPADTRRDARLPVMVWIYGGGFISGTGASPIYDGSALARDKVIVVNLNYRLGRFGWFAYPELTREGGAASTGNFGLMDQMAALKWVRDNIAAFGGDPANVTVFGESAGAMCVNTLMSIPAAQGLFAKAITESGFGRHPARPLAAAEMMGSAFAQRVGASDLAALRNLSAETVLGPPDTDMTGSDEPELILDGKLISANVAAAFAAGNEAKVPWMVGSNNYEASLFAGALAKPDAVLAGLPEATRDAVMKLYDPGKRGDQTAVVAGMLTDRDFTEPARYLATSHARSGEPVYRYFFGYVPQMERGRSPGAGHGAELQFVFGNLGAGQSSNTRYTAADKRTAAAMGRYWTNFAKSGNPNGRGLIRWPKDGRDNILVFNAGGQHAASGFRKPQLDFAARQASAP
jgi:para-nitrobenzyl esterase